MACEVGALLHAGKDEVGVLFFEFVALGAVANEDAGDVGVAFAYLGKGFGGKGNVFLGGEAADEEGDDTFVWVDSPALA